MELHNLKILDCNIENKDKIIDAIKEIDIIISDNFDILKNKEFFLEFSLGSRLDKKEYFVLYLNPNYAQNPYAFILESKDGEKVLKKSTTLESFKELADYSNLKDFNKILLNGFNNLPRYIQFLSNEQIKQAKKMIEEER